MVKAYGEAAGKELPYKMAPRREGDCASKVAIPNKAKDILGW